MRKLSTLCTIAIALTLGAFDAAAQKLEVSGSVATTRGAGLAGATVELRPLLPAHQLAELQLSGRLWPKVKQRTRTDRDGDFRLAAPAGFWQLVIRQPEYLPVSFDLSPLLIRRDLPRLQMQHRSEVAARLVDSDGSPIAGVTLVVAGWSEQWKQATGDGWWPIERVARTDRDGFAALPCASSEAVTLVAVHDGRFLYHKTACEAGLVELSLDVGLRPVHLVHAGDVPAVSAYGFFRWPFVAFGVSDEQGQVHGPFVAPEAVPVVFADELGWCGRPRWPAPTEDVPSDDAPSDDALSADGGSVQELPTLRLPPTEIFRGQAVDAYDKSPVDNVWLWLGRGSRSFQAVDRGAFELRVPVGGRRAGSNRLSMPNRPVASFGGPGYLTVTYPSPSAGAADLTVRMTPAMTLSGRVINAGGDGVAGAQVAGGQGANLVFKQRSADIQGGGLLQLDPIGARTAGDGSFELRRLPPQRSFELRVSSPGFATHYATASTLEPGVIAPELVIVLERGVTGFGRVVNESEMPIVGAEVALLPSLTGAAAEQSYEVKENYRTTTVADGRFTLADLPVGRFYLAAKATGFPELLVPGIEIAGAAAIEPEPVDLGTLVLAPGIQLSGRVVDASNEPVATAQLSLRNADGEQVVVQRADSLWFASAISRQNGSFHLEGLPGDSRLILLVSADGYLAQELAVTTDSEDQRLDIELSRGAQVTGVVLDPSGRPTAGARVDLDAGPELQRISMTNSRSVLTDSEGRFEASGLRPGEYTFSARHLEAESEPLRQQVPAAGLSGVYLELRRKATLVVTVRDPQGGLVPHASVLLLPETSPTSRPPRNSEFKRTDATGLAMFQPLDAGAYRLTARHSELGSAEAVIEVQAAGERHFELRLTEREEEQAKLEVSGRVVDPAGLPVGGARVWLAGTGSSQPARSGADGGFTVAAVPGEYRVVCRHQRFAVYKGQPFNLAGRGVSGLIVELPVGAVVTGRITGLELEDLARLAVFARGPYQGNVDGGQAFGQRYGTVDFEGELRIDGLEAGEWVVRAELLNPTRSASERVEVDSGGQVRVDLHFATGHRLTGSVLGPGGPLAGCTVSVSCAAEFRGRTFTDRTGRFVIEHLPEGRCEVSATDPEGGRSNRQEIELSFDTEIVLEIKSPG